MTREAEILASEQMRDRIAEDMVDDADRLDARGNERGRRQAALLRAWVRRILDMPGRLAIHIQEQDVSR